METWMLFVMAIGVGSQARARIGGGTPRLLIRFTILLCSPKVLTPLLFFKLHLGLLGLLEPHAGLAKLLWCDHGDLVQEHRCGCFASRSVFLQDTRTELGVFVLKVCEWKLAQRVECVSSEKAGGCVADGAFLY